MVVNYEQNRIQFQPQYSGPSVGWDARPGLIIDTGGQQLQVKEVYPWGVKFFGELTAHYEDLGDVIYV